MSGIKIPVVEILLVLLCTVCTLLNVCFVIFFCINNKSQNILLILYSFLFIEKEVLN